MNEEWEPVEGGLPYEVNRTGVVRRSIAAPIRNSTRRGRILIHDTSTGYSRVSLLGKKVLVHRLVAVAFIGPNVPNMHVNHKDGNKLNNNADNLEWATPKENVNHAWANGLCRAVSGERHGAHKLRDSEAQAIRVGLLNGISGCVLARMFNVTESTVSQIKHNKTRKIA